jgi:hypothetical protein
MKLARNLIVVTGSALLVALAGCATTRNPLADSAEVLDRNAQALAAQADAMTPVLEQDAHRLAESTYQFRGVVGANGTDNTRARTAFESVSQNYRRVNEDVNHINTEDARAALRRVKEAYQDVERAMGAGS